MNDVTSTLMPIFSKSGLERVIEVNEVYMSEAKNLLHELAGLGLGLVAGVTAVYAFGIKAVVQFLYYTIVVLAKIIKTVIAQLVEMFGLVKGLLGKLVAAESTITLSEGFADVDAGVILEYSPDEAVVTITGYRMDFDVNTILTKLLSEAYGTYDAIYFNVLNESKDIFESRDHMLSLIAEKRARILGQATVPTRMTIKEFASAFREMVFGKPNTTLTYSYKAVKAISKANKAKTVNIQNLLSGAITDAKNGLLTLEAKKSEIKRNPEMSTNSIRDNFQIQLNWLIEYRTTVMKDQIIIFDTLIKYIRMVDAQTRLIHTKAIQTHLEV